MDYSHDKTDALKEQYISFEELLRRSSWDSGGPKHDIVDNLRLLFAVGEEI